VRYDNIGIKKPGQFDAGSGTTPTLMGRGYLSITDNADPMQVVVMRRAKRLPRGQHRVVCERTVFRKGASATENSIIATGRSMIVENNYGYIPPPDATSSGNTTAPGVERVDIAPRRQGLPQRLAQPRDLPEHRPEAVARERAHLPLHEAQGHPRPLVRDRDRLSHGTDPLAAADRHGPALQRALRRADDQPPWGPLRGRAGRNGGAGGRLTAGRAGAQGGDLFAGRSSQDMVRIVRGVE
jgi:hypothetical protein